MKVLSPILTGRVSETFASLVRVKQNNVEFLVKYMRKFCLLRVDGKLIIHSHLPAVNSKAFTRFIAEHLLAKKQGPSHA